jgi:hypothetical protein
VNRRRVPILVLAGVLALAPAAGWAQSPGPHLVIVAPKQGAVTGPDVVAVIDAVGVPDGTAVAFQLSIDSRNFERTFAVRAGTPGRIPLGKKAPGQHRITVTAPAPEMAPAQVTFSIREPGATSTGTGFNPLAILVAIALVGVFLFYRRRVMEPFTRKYEGDRREQPPGGRPSR